MQEIGPYRRTIHYTLYTALRAYYRYVRSLNNYNLLANKPRSEGRRHAESGASLYFQTLTHTKAKRNIVCALSDSPSTCISLACLNSLAEMNLVVRLIVVCDHIKVNLVLLVE